MKRLVLVFVAAFAVVAAVPGVAGAHGGATVTVHSDGRGSVWMTAAWQDGHPVTEPMQVSLTATHGAAAVGPVVLRPTGDSLATQVYDSTLPVGVWQAVVQLGPPVSGRCQANVQVAAVGAAPLPLEVACLIASTASIATNSTGAAGFPVWMVAVALVLLAGGAVGVAVLRSRSRNGQRVE